MAKKNKEINPHMRRFKLYTKEEAILRTENVIRALNDTIESTFGMGESRDRVFLKVKELIRTIKKEYFS